ncbi:type II secretion system protein [Prochlorococcus sp. MIT 1307]|uniref:type II secretion system protein n=1 Tax=Prochlorococcus sp. MIT 1307 TaxID=3096219 RepID=UPI002A75C156|nr:type II secretion system protein [Prochlorococcus sp. MIT 1307]
MFLCNRQNQLIARLASKIDQRGFSSNEMVVVVASIGILATITIPLLTPIIEIAEVLIAEKYLLGAVKECQMGLINGEKYPIYTMPPQSIGLGFISTRKFQFLNNGADGECLSPSSGNILTAARAGTNQTFSIYDLNINVVTGEKNTVGEVPSWIDWWEGVYSPLIQENDPLLP